MAFIRITFRTYAFVNTPDRERFYLTAADQQSGTRDERLKNVIRAKFEAGLLKPYDYARGYARMYRWLEGK